LTPGPDSSHTTVTFTVYDDASRSAFTSIPIIVASRTTWLDPNTATDSSTGKSPTGSATYMDAAGRTIAGMDPIFQAGGSTGISCPSLTQLTQSWTTPLTHASSCVVYGLGTS